MTTAMPHPKQDELDNAAIQKSKEVTEDEIYKVNTMTYQALRRKADKQWMRIGLDDSLIKSNTPKLHSKAYFDAIMEDNPEIDWTLYEIIEVAVIPVDEMPTLQECANYGIKKYEDNHKATYWLQGIRWFADNIGLHL